MSEGGTRESGSQGGIGAKGAGTKRVSIGHHILQLLIAALAVMAVVMLIFVHILANVAVEYDIKMNLERELYKCHKEISINAAGQILSSDDFFQRDGEIVILVIDASGKVLAGEYPKGYPKDIELGVKKLQQASVGKETYYIRDIRKYIDNGPQIYVRGVVRRSDTYSRYQMMEYLAAVSILIVSGVAILGGVLLSKRISGSLKDMCRTAEGIGQNMNMSKRMEYDGRFYELDVLAHANNRMLDRLEETFRQQEQFTSDVAHELRTPIAVMTAQCQYVREKSVSREEVKEAFEVIERQTSKVNTIISRLLELSRLDYDRRGIQKDDVDLPEIVQSVCEDLQLKSGDSLRFQLKLSDAHVIGDINLVMIAIQNLLTNAVKYSMSGSVIEVETGMRDKMAYVIVKDYGMGIRESDLAHIFKRFYKADKSRNSEGFGLGLPLTMKIAQKHGGTVLVESREGEGSTFILQLPDIEEVRL